MTKNLKEVGKCKGLLSFRNKQSQIISPKKKERKKTLNKQIKKIVKK